MTCSALAVNGVDGLAKVVRDGVGRQAAAPTWDGPGEAHRSAGRSLALKENHDLRGADGPHTRHRDAADDPPALGRIAVERVLQGLWTELAAPPAVFLRQHLIFHGLSTSLKRPANDDFYGVPTRTRANVKH